MRVSACETGDPRQKRDSPVIPKTSVTVDATKPAFSRGLDKMAIRVPDMRCAKHLGTTAMLMRRVVTADIVTTNTRRSGRSGRLSGSDLRSGSGICASPYGAV